MESWLEWEIPKEVDYDDWDLLSRIRFEVLQGKPVVPTIEFYTTVTATEMVYALYGTDGM